MELNDWILALHLLSAVGLVAAVVLFWILVVAVRNVDMPAPTISLGRVARVGNFAVAAGTIGTIVFGVWLALSLDAYDLWDAWVLAAIVLWAISSATGGIAGKEYTRGFDRARELDAAGEQGRERRAPRVQPLAARAAVPRRDLGRDPPHPDRHDLEAGRMSVVGLIRPDSGNFPLFLHVFGAMILVGGLLTGAASLALARGEVRMLRLGYWSLLAVALPGWVLMRAGAGWIYSKEHLDDLPDDPAWVGIGFITAEAGGLLLLVSLIMGGIGVRKLRTGGGAGLLKASMAISILLLAAYVVAIWAMGAKPD